MSSRKRSLLKVIILGEAGVGKTSLMNQFVNKRFSCQYKATIGADFQTTEMIVGDTLVNLQIWDTAGQERFQSLGGAFYRGADCCLLVYDVTSAASFSALQHWREEFLLQAAPHDPSNFPFVVVGNKVDLPNNRVISKRQAETWCMENGDLIHMDASARIATNVEAAFQAAADGALRREPPDDLLDQLPTHLTLGDDRDRTPVRKCPCEN